MTEKEAFESWCMSSPTYKAILDNFILRTFCYEVWKARGKCDLGYKDAQTAPVLEALEDSVAVLDYLLPQNTEIIDVYLSIMETSDKCKAAIKAIEEHNE